MALADWASVAVAGGLLVVTAVYTFFTAAQLKPYLKASIIFDGTDQMYFVIQNTGKGAAHDVSAKWYTQALDAEPRNWSIPLIHPGKRHRFAIPLGPRNQRFVRIEDVKDQVGENIGRIEYQASCKDVVFRTHRFHEFISIKKALNRMDSAGELPESETLREIRDAIEHIQLETITSESEGSEI